MAISTSMCSSFKKELLEARHNFLLSGGNTFKLALIKSAMAGTYGAASTNYSDITGNVDEASGTNYSAGGGTLTRIDPSLSSTTALTDFADLTFSTATITARGCMIYNSTSSDRAVLLNDFGSDKTATAGDFTIVFPTADASNAIIRIA
jgi:hypothetical protein